MKNLQILLFDLTGHFIFSQTKQGVKGLNQITFNTQDFAQGVYLIKVKTSLGEVVEKVIVF